ncbi:diadenylate cyclase CdaA [Desulfovibrio sp. OttesenSCG-928-A18]|nr:diadenylate cyclase CdaA [Desulfovibrio sp. OttesenSCG-928-A18]
MDLYFLTNFSFSWRDILDVALVTLLFYNIIALVRRTRAVTAIYGLIIIIASYFVSRALGLVTLNWLLEYVLGSIFLLVVIVFQRDIRQALTTIGARRISLPFLRRKQHDESSIAAICEAAQYMAQRRIGALMVIERHVPLEDVSQRAVRLDAVISKELLISLFWPNSPLHDGAAVIRNKRIASAGCILPLSTAVAKRDYGTRHRAALGITEETDAVVVVVSEERGAVAVAVDGRLTGALDAVKLPKVIASAMERKL